VIRNRKSPRQDLNSTTGDSVTVPFTQTCLGSLIAFEGSQVDMSQMWSDKVQKLRGTLAEAESRLATCRDRANECDESFSGAPEFACSEHESIWIGQHLFEVFGTRPPTVASGSTV
jgi:hypothetical protein